jgi:hypothetical protein
MAEPENLDALRWFRKQLEALKEQHPELTSPEAQERLEKELARLAVDAEPDDKV